MPGSSNAVLSGALDALQGAAGLPLSRAVTLPADVYSSPEFFDWETQNVLERDWLCVAHISQLPSAGDFINLDLLDEPLIVIRGKDDMVRTLSRVCPHRGMDIMPPGFGYDGHGPAERREGGVCHGHTRLLLCPYHAWTFELDGGLKACPEMQHAEGFRRDEQALKAFPTIVWNGFVLVNLSGDAADPTVDWAEMAEDLAPWNPSAMEVVIELEWECPFDWKVLVENFMESYHHLGIHSKTLQPMMPARDTWTEQERRRYVRAHLPIRPELVREREKKDSRGDYRDGFPLIADLGSSKGGEWGLFLGYPCLLLFAGPDRLIWYRVHPEGPGRMRLLTTVLVPRDRVGMPGWAEMLARETEMLKTFHLEDVEVCTAVQRSYGSRGFQRGRLSHLEMPVWLLHRFLAARARGVWPGDDGELAAGQRAEDEMAEAT